jgi:hypothetical protein
MERRSFGQEEQHPELTPFALFGDLSHKQAVKQRPMPNDENRRSSKYSQDDPE